MGHNFMFSKLDVTDGTVRFFDEREPTHNGKAILAAAAPLQLVESILARLDELIETVSELQNLATQADAARRRGVRLAHAGLRGDDASVAYRRRSAGPWGGPELF